MDIRYSGKNIRVTQGIKDHLEERISRLDKFAPKIVESHAVLTKEKHSYVAHISLLGKNLHAHAHGDHKENIYAAIDQAVDKIQKQLKKYREKIKEHYKEHGTDVESPKEKIAREIMEKDSRYGFTPAIIPIPAPSSKKPMSSEEASMQLEMSSKMFLVFMDSKSNKLNVIFKLGDGNHGLIEPQF